MITNEAEVYDARTYKNKYIHNYIKKEFIIQKINY